MTRTSDHDSSHCCNIASTIFALSTPPGKSGVAVIRISGKYALQAIQNFGCTKEMTPRLATYMKLFSYLNPAECLDMALIIYFPAPHSFTGEDVIELHIHGSIAVMDCVMNELNHMKFLRPAEPGEFTKRAFINGKLDIVRVEALSELIHAETRLCKSIALQQFSGQLKALYEEWKSTLINIMAKFEALIDFPEEYISQSVLNDASDEAKSLAQSIATQLKRSNQADIIMGGINVALIGPPNSGKSTLLNLVTQKDISIVSEIPGTTRDVIIAQGEIGGIRVVFHDTAGIHQTNDMLEQEGIKRTKNVIATANVVILLFDIHTSMQDVQDVCSKLQECVFHDFHILCFINKIDLLYNNDDVIDRTAEIAGYITNHFSAIHTITHISALSCESADIIYKELQKIITRYSISGNDVVITNIRQKNALQACLQYIEGFLYELKIEDHFDLAVQNLRYAALELERISGNSVQVDDVIDSIFANFCIGK